MSDDKTTPTAPRECPPGYRFDREQVKPQPCSCLLTGMWTDLKGLRLRYAPPPTVPYATAGGRPAAIRCVWVADPPRDAAQAAREGWWPHDAELPPACPPHFAIAEDGEIVQFLDPARAGSDVRGSGTAAEGRSFPARSTVVIANLGRKATGRTRPTKAQLAALSTLVDVLQRIYWHPKLYLEGPWERT
jgi:hypothetical protein